MKKILFISCCIPDELKDEITKFCKYPVNIHDAANTFQKSLIHGFIENDVYLEVLTAPSLPAYPKGYNKLWVPELHSKIENRILCHVLPYTTFIFGKYVSMEKVIVKSVTEWIKRYKSEDLFIIAYNVNPAFMGALQTIKKNNPKVHTSLIVTDMIEDAENFKSNRSIFKRVQLFLHKRKVLASYWAIDKYILLSERMKDRIFNCKDNYIVIEGVFSPREIEYKCIREKVIFYSGALDIFVNVKEMVEAFKLLKQNDYKLVICGAGPLSGYIKEEAQKNKNIIYLGSIPRNEVIEWQHKSSILVNPRQPSDITKYSFPSKTMEYFASGTPVLMYNLQGIPNEYYSYCYTIHGTTINDFRDSLEKVLSISENEREEIGSKARQFIMRNKTSKIQVDKIIQFLLK